MFQQRHKTQRNQKFQEIILTMQMRHFPNNFWNIKHKTVPKEIYNTGNRIPDNGIWTLVT